MSGALRTRLRSHYRFILPYRTRWSDNDQYGHLNNSIYNFLIDSVVNAYLIKECGLKPNDSNATTPIGVVASSSVLFFQSLEFPAVAELGLRVNKLGNSSVIYEVGIFEEGIESVCAVGSVVHVFVGKTERKPVPMVKEMRDGLEKIFVEETPNL